MNERCHDCAFTIGTLPSKTVHTVAVAKLCALTGDRFDCHIHDGVCIGWAEEVAERKAKGALLQPGDAGYQAAMLLSELVTQAVRLGAKADEEAGLTTRNT